MKTKLSTLTLIVYLAAFAFACSDKKQEAGHDEHAGMEHATTESEPVEAAAPEFVVAEEFQKQLATAFAAYVELKDAFVATDAALAKTKATSLQQALGTVDMELLTDAAHNDWMNYLSGLDNALKEIQANDDVELQRTAFSLLSDNMYKSIKAFGLGGSTAYYEYCPMAFNNQGGYWLSDNDAVRNPYFGDKMLKCGSVKEKLQ
ncbi:MAG: DUF3347 domain-containing protein [Cyclobacteriaceae bacterium]|nr:DUF3347 domain-containing protein [Cyclobacteriaceae bacterium]